jgi:hypothetical protein
VGWKPDKSIFRRIFSEEMMVQNGKKSWRLLELPVFGGGRPAYLAI